MSTVRDVIRAMAVHRSNLPVRVAVGNRVYDVVAIGRRWEDDGRDAVVVVTANTPRHPTLTTAA